MSLDWWVGVEVSGGIGGLDMLEGSSCRSGAEGEGEVSSEGRGSFVFDVGTAAEGSDAFTVCGGLNPSTTTPANANS